LGSPSESNQPRPIRTHALLRQPCATVEPKMTCTIWKVRTTDRSSSSTPAARLWRGSTSKSWQTPRSSALTLEKEEGRRLFPRLSVRDNPLLWAQGLRADEIGEIVVTFTAGDSKGAEWNARKIANWTKTILCVSYSSAWSCCRRKRRFQFRAGKHLREIDLELAKRSSVILAMLSRTYLLASRRVRECLADNSRVSATV